MEKKSMPLDAVDLALLNLLQRDAFLTTKELAAQLHLTATPVFERIRRLEREGYIRRYAAFLDRCKLGLSLLVFCDISLKEHKREYLLRFEEEVSALPEVLECHHITGAFDYMLKVVVSNMEAYQHFIREKLAILDNIGQVQSHFVMTEVKSETALPLGGEAMS